MTCTFCSKLCCQDEVAAKRRQGLHSLLCLRLQQEHPSQPNPVVQQGFNIAIEHTVPKAINSNPSYWLPLASRAPGQGGLVRAASKYKHGVVQVCKCAGVRVQRLRLGTSFLLDLLRDSQDLKPPQPLKWPGVDGLMEHHCTSLFSHLKGRFGFYCAFTCSAGLSAGTCSGFKGSARSVFGEEGVSCLQRPNAVLKPSGVSLRWSPHSNPHQQPQTSPNPKKPLNRHWEPRPPTSPPSS